LLDLSFINAEQFDRLNSLTSLSEPLGKYLEIKSWISVKNLVEAFRHQMQLGLYALLQLKSGQFYFMAREQFPYAEMTGFNKGATDAALEGLNSQTDSDRSDLPKLSSYFSRISDRYSTLNLSMTELSLMNWLKTPKTLDNFSQMMKIEPLEVQMTCKRLQKLGLIEESIELVKVTMKEQKEPEQVKSQKIDRELLNKFSSFLTQKTIA
jgi:hypothetical protein